MFVFPLPVTACPTHHPDTQPIGLPLTSVTPFCHSIKMVSVRASANRKTSDANTRHISVSKQGCFAIFCAEWLPSSVVTAGHAGNHVGYILMT